MGAHKQWQELEAGTKERSNAPKELQLIPGITTSKEIRYQRFLRFGTT